MATSGLASRAAVDGVRIVHWPSEQDLLHALARTAVPRLVVVAAGTDPPVAADCCQDWMWASGDGLELRLRLRTLALRALAHGHGRPRLDAAGILRVGPRWIHLAPKERALAEVLIERFNEHVPAQELIDAVWPDGINRRNVLASRISGLRSRLSWLGLEVRGSSNRGYSVGTRTAPTATEQPLGFEDEVDVSRWLNRGAPAPGYVRTWSG